MISKKNIVSIIILFFSIIGIITVNPKGIEEMFKWLAMCFTTSFLLRPIFINKQLKFIDGGFVFSLGFGPAVSFLFLYLLSGFGLLPFNKITCLTSLLFLAVFINYLTYKNKISFKWDKENFDSFLLGFAIFSLIFIVCCYFKGFRPYITNQTEEYMNLGILNKLYRQESFPLEDLWFAKVNLNYYYLGHAVLVYLMKISFTTPNVVYNLAQCTLTAFIFIATFVLTEAIISTLLNRENKKLNILGALSGAITATLAGNGDWLINGIFKRLITHQDYWFAQAVSSLSKADGSDNLLHETTAYALVLGDLHAHLIVTFFTLPLLAILLDYAAYRKNINQKNRSVFKKIFDEIFSPYILSVALLLGIISGANHWDYPIFFIISGTIILFTDLLKTNNKTKTLLIVLFKGMVVYLISYLIILPFNLQFQKNYTSIFLVDRHTNIFDLLSIWGLHIFGALFVIIWILRRKTDADSFRLSVVGLILCSLGLILLPEIIYLKDIYGSEYQRYNTMFKLTFEAFIILGIFIGVYIGLIFSKKRKINIIVGTISFMFVLLMGSYIFECINDWFGNKNYKSLSTEEFFNRNNVFKEQLGAVDYINSDNNKNIVVLQRAGESYKESNWLSVFTGTSTLVGWESHEWIWRNDWPIVAARDGEVRIIYESGNEEICKELIDKYGIDYIYIGDEELNYYSINYSGFTNLTNKVWSSIDNKYSLYKVKG